MENANTQVEEKTHDIPGCAGWVGGVEQVAVTAMGAVALVAAMAVLGHRIRRILDDLPVGDSAVVDGPVHNPVHNPVHGVGDGHGHSHGRGDGHGHGSSTFGSTARVDSGPFDDDASGGLSGGGRLYNGRSSDRRGSAEYDSLGPIQDEVGLELLQKSGRLV